MSVAVRQQSENRGAICNGLLRALPSWFGIESAVQRYVHDAETMPAFVAWVDEEAVGMISLKLHNQWTGEVHLMAIHPDFHRQGIGRKLLDAVESHLKNLKYEFLSVKTLSPSKPDKYYDMTREFYFSTGFRPVEEFTTIWGAENPCLLMIKNIEKTGSAQ